MYNWRLFKKKREHYRCKCWMTDSCAPCPEPPWVWKCNVKEKTKALDPQQIFLLDHDGNYLGMFHQYE